MAKVDSVNLGRPKPNPHKEIGWTGISKQPTEGPVDVRAPGSRITGLGSGLVEDFIGDRKHHGGNDQAVYAFQREDLDEWERRLGRELPNGFFGENLTTVGLDVNDARIGERWRIGEEVVLQVTAPRIPCSTFRGWMAEKGWAKTFTAAGRPGASYCHSFLLRRRTSTQKRLKWHAKAGFSCWVKTLSRLHLA